MAGYTPQLAAVVWVGRPNPGPIRDAAGKPIDGAGLPASIWRKFLTDALTGQPVRSLPPPDFLVPEHPARLIALCSLHDDSRYTPAAAIQACSHSPKVVIGKGLAVAVIQGVRSRVVIYCGRVQFAGL
jgi:membrane peptidoglycan carboxypeptidase